MPALFLGHGSPMNTLENNRYTQAWWRVGKMLPHPRAILCVSAHWYTNGTGVTAMPHPKTIHDFHGFPQALFEVRYPAPGNPALATRVQELLRPVVVEADQSWGLDHGAWSVLVHVYPAADIPVVQLSIDATQPGRFHYDLGRRLAPLRDEGILIVGSGNVVHNLGMMRRDGAPYAWAPRVEQKIEDCIARRDHAPLIDYERLDAEMPLAAPTPEHYLPLLYVLGLQQDDEAATVLIDGIEMSSLSMLSVGVGLAADR